VTWRVVIPSKDDRNILECVSSLIETHPDITPDQIVVVDDGLSRETHRELCDVTRVRGKRPFIFARNINVGVRAAHDGGIIIMGDDVRIVTPRLFDTLESRSQGVAAISPEVLGLCGQAGQCVGSRAMEVPWMAFICIYIPRCIWEVVGPLDESFVGYGYDDVDWSLRSAPYGPLKVDHSQRVIHTERSSFRTTDTWKDLYEKNLAIFEAKWGKLERAA
jgi:GT2 family glycosyltransferase